MARRATGLRDRHGSEIHEGDMVSLDGLMTADDSLGLLPNGFIYNKDDVYLVVWDDRIDTWGLDVDVEPDTPFNIKYMNHTIGLLHDGEVEIWHVEREGRAQEVD